MKIQILREIKRINVIFIFLIIIINCKSAREECYEAKSFYFNNCLIKGIIQNNSQKLIIDPADIDCNLWIQRELNCNKKDPLIPNNLIL
jgi:hypothetical protein